MLSLRRTIDLSRDGSDTAIRGTHGLIELAEDHAALPWVVLRKLPREIEKLPVSPNQPQRSKNLTF